MKGEIDKRFYCSSELYEDGYCLEGISTCINCASYHRKWPTPEQYREEYGEDYPDDGAVYYIDSDDPRDTWELDILANAIEDERYAIVCCVTPWGKPPDNWRPE